MTPWGSSYNATNLTRLTSVGDMVLKLCILRSVTEYYTATNFLKELFKEHVTDVAFQAKFHPFSDILYSAIYRLVPIPDMFIHCVSISGLRKRWWILMQDRLKIYLLHLHSNPKLHLATRNFLTHEQCQGLLKYIIRLIPIIESSV